MSARKTFFASLLFSLILVLALSSQAASLTRSSGVETKTLIIHVKNDQWLRYVLAEEAAKKIPGAKLEGFESPLAHYAVFQAPNVLQEQIKGFFKEIGMQ